LAVNFKSLSLDVVQGQVKELDALAQQFVGADAKKRKNLFKQATAAADAVDTSASPDTSSYVEYYIKTMQRVLDKGDSYLAQVGVERTCLSPYCLGCSGWCSRAHNTTAQRCHVLCA
jgi:hypothetical protein